MMKTWKTSMEQSKHFGLPINPEIGFLSSWIKLLDFTKTGGRRVLSRFNLKETVKELAKLGEKHGIYFLIYAVFIEIVEDLIIPGILCWLGKPHIIPVALAFHCEPIAYPLYFMVASLFRKKSAFNDAYSGNITPNSSN